MDKKILRILFCGLLVTSCTNFQNNKSISEQMVEVPEEIDDFSEVDATTGAATDYEAMNDGLFDDFIYRFMQDSLFQHSRIHFPITYREDGSEREVAETAWTYDSIFSFVNECSSVVDGRDSVATDAGVDAKKVTLEVVDLKAERVKLYHFGRRGVHWVLNEIDEHFFHHDKNHGFFMFYGRFSNDEDYQLKHVQDPFYFKTYDAENFHEIEGWVSADSWPDYRTFLPNEKLLNTIYDDVRPATNYRRLSIGSPSSGMSCSLVFKRTKGQWKLVSMEN